MSVSVSTCQIILLDFIDGMGWFFLPAFRLQFFFTDSVCKEEILLSSLLFFQMTIYI